MFPSILIRTGVFRDRFAVNAISYVAQICLNQFFNLKKFEKISKNLLKQFFSFMAKIKFWKTFFKFEFEKMKRDWMMVYSIS